MQVTQKRRIIQVGLGAWGFSWLDIIRGSPDWELAGIVDRDAAALDRVGQHYGLGRELLHTSLAEAHRAGAPDAALVVVPPEAHAPVTLEAAALGLHCLVEKPIADNIRDAGAMVEAARQHGVTLMVSQNYRFKRAPETVRRLVRSGIIGEIGSVFINFQKAPPFTGFRTEMAHPLITDMAIHHFDQIRGILGLEPERVCAVSWNPPWSWFAGDPTANVVFEMMNGARVVYTGSWVSRGWQTTWDGDWRIQGSEGEIHWADNEVHVHPSNVFTSVFVRGARETRGRMIVDLAELEQEDRWASLAEFAVAIREAREPVTSGADNLRTLAMVLGARRSIEMGGQPVAITELLTEATSGTGASGST